MSMHHVVTSSFPPLVCFQSGGRLNTDRQLHAVAVHGSSPDHLPVAPAAGQLLLLLLLYHVSGCYCRARGAAPCR